MANGFGAGFFGLALLALLLGLAALLALGLVVVVVIRRRAGTVPGILEYGSLAVLGAVLLVAGFGVAAMYDEAVFIAVLLLLLVFVPLAAVGLYLDQTTGRSRLDTLATTGMAWGVPFVVGTGITFGLMIGVSSALGLAPAEPEQVWVTWTAMLVGGVVVLAGSLLLGKHLSRSLAAPRSE
jgi:hypothetical protein